MKKKVLCFIFILIILSSIISADDINKKVKKANELYRKQKYKKSLKIYKNFEEKIDSFGIYYNMGNINYKLNEYAYAKYYYLKALKLKPNNEEVRDNLNLTLANLDNQIKVPEKSLLNQLLQDFIEFFSINISSVLFLISLLIFSIIFYHKDMNKRKIYLYILTGLIIIFFTISYISYSKFSEKRYVYLSEKLEVRSEPNKSSTTLFQVYPGNEFKIKDKNNGWILIVLKNGYRGWIKTEKYKRI